MLHGGASSDGTTLPVDDAERRLRRASSFATWSEYAAGIWSKPSFSALLCALDHLLALFTCDAVDWLAWFQVRDSGHSATERGLPLYFFEAAVISAAYSSSSPTRIRRSPPSTPPASSPAPPHRRAAEPALH